MSTITGTTKSRLVEVEKYSKSGDLSKRYITLPNLLGNGIILSESIDGVRIVYKIGSIEYVDYLNSSGNTTATTYNYQSLNPIEYDYGHIIKDFSKGNVIDLPEVQEDVFITRQTISVFENQYRLRNIGNLIDLTEYAGGGFFNINNNI